MHLITILTSEMQYTKLDKQESLPWEELGIFFFNKSILHLDIDAYDS